MFFENHFSTLPRIFLLSLRSKGQTFTTVRDKSSLSLEINDNFMITLKIHNFLLYYPNCIISSQIQSIIIFTQSKFFSQVTT